MKLAGSKALARLLLLPAWAFLCLFTSTGRCDVLLLKSGKEVQGTFLFVDLLRVGFATPDGLDSDYPRDQVLGVFAGNEKPVKPVKQDELRVGGTTVKGVLVHYRAKDAYAIYATAKGETLLVKALTQGDGFRFAKLAYVELARSPKFEGIVGTWKGDLGGKLRVTFRITQEEGKLSGTVQLGNLAKVVRPFQGLTIKDRSIRIDLGTNDREWYYEGELDEKWERIDGKWFVGEKGQDLALARDLSGSRLPAALEGFKRESAFAKSALEGMKQLQEKNLEGALSLGKLFLGMSPAGPDVEKVRSHLDRLLEALRKEVGNIFKISAVSLEKGRDGLEYLLYHIYSKWPSFEDLRCEVWVQLVDDTVLEESFLYYTVRPGNKHYDSVGVPSRSPRAVRYRVVLSYQGFIAAEKEGGPPGEPSWWKKAGGKLSYWGLPKADDKDKGPTYYFSHSLGKRGIDGVR